MSIQKKELISARTAELDFQTYIDVEKSSIKSTNKNRMDPGDLLIISY